MIVIIATCRGGCRRSWALARPGLAARDRAIAAGACLVVGEGDRALDKGRETKYDTINIRWYRSDHMS